jgi:hypothetical protein
MRDVNRRSTYMDKMVGLDSSGRGPAPFNMEHLGSFYYKLIVDGEVKEPYEIAFFSTPPQLPHTIAEIQHVVKSTRHQTLREIEETSLVVHGSNVSKDIWPLGFGEKWDPAYHGGLDEECPLVIIATRSVGDQKVQHFAVDQSVCGKCVRSKYSSKRD